MNNVTKVTVALVVVAVIGAAVFMLTKNDDKTNDASDQAARTSQNPTSAEGQTSENETIAATITYDGNGFTASVDKVAAGSKVKIVNNSQSELEFVSDPHPVHTDNPELNVGDIEPGKSKTFTVSAKGTWGFHNHYDSNQRGKLTVE